MKAAFNLHTYLLAKRTALLNIATNCLRAVYSHLLDKRIRSYTESGRKYGYDACAGLLTYLKHEEDHLDKGPAP